MAKALLITREDLVRFTSVNGGVDTDKFIQYISISQDIHIQAMTGTRLLEKIQADIIADTLVDPYLTLLNDYIKPALIHFAMVEYYPHAAYTIANKGVYKHGAENSETVSKEEVDFLMEKQRQLAMNYKERFVDYVINNSSSFPEYYSNVSPDVYPDQNTNMTGWVL
tara:strand:+ start:1201 stop:1701 length:501 start_codon:yes stop_codon:yes gene_type:complete